MQYRKVDIGDGGIGSKTIADVSSSFCSNVVALHNGWWSIDQIEMTVSCLIQSTILHEIERESSTSRLTLVTEVLVWRASLMRRAPFGPILLACIVDYQRVGW